MQITLNQAEIETAIKKYVNDQVVIREDQDITIDLKAGRGPEGFTANIEIVPAGSAKPSSPESAPSTPSKPLGITKAVSKPATTPAPAASVPDAPETVSETAQEAAEEAPAQTGTNGAGKDQKGAGDAQDKEADPGEATPPEGGKSKSLFSNLGKPRN